MKVKRIIDGEGYDTEGSTLIAKARYESPSDKDQYSEALYRNDHEVFFLAADGGVETYYASLFEGGKLAPGTEIIPLTTTETRRWLEDHDHIEEIEQLFGVLPEAGQNTVGIDLRVSPDLKARIELAAAIDKESVNTWLTRIIERKLG